MKYGKSRVTLGLQPLTIEDVVSLARGHAELCIDERPEFRESIERSARQFAERLANGERIYGVTTGFGESSRTPVSGPA